MAIRIRDVEKKLFSYLFLNKVATSKQIARDIYPSISHQALYKRLNRLIKDRKLSANYHRELEGRLAYSLSRIGLDEFLSGNSSKEVRKQLQSNSVLHDLDLVDIRSRLKSLEKVERYYPENLIRSQIELEDSDGIDKLRSFRFDAILRIRGANRSMTLPLEYERSLKFSGRYKAYIKKLYSESQIEVMLLVGGNAKILRRLQAIEREVIGEAWPKLFYASLENLVSSKDSVRFQNLNGDKITLE